jgi:hypothetical protein
MSATAEGRGMRSERGAGGDGIAHGAMLVVWQMVAVPILLYFASFAILTFPFILQFNRAFLTDREDGYQMIWDEWWVRYSILKLHRSPFTTPLLHFPFGTSLWLHTLMPFNGLLSIPLTAIFSEIHAFNLIIVLGFVGSGVTAFWLCWNVTRSYWPSLAGGFAFECCSYRWAHSFGHVNLISTEAFPLFLLGLLTLSKRPRIPTAIGTAMAMLVALLCDQYQFLYCVLSCGVLLVWWVFSGRIGQNLRRRHLIAFAAFLVTSLLTCGPIVLGMLHESGHPPLRSHDADWYSADLLGPWVPDWAWLYSEWTRPVWSPLSNSSVEKSICLGPAVVIAAFCAFFPRRRPPRLRLGSLSLFAALAVTFMLLAFGPTWRVVAIPITTYTPYRLLAFLLPPLRLAGCTARMMIVTQLAVSVLAAAGLSRLARVKTAERRSALTVLFVIALVFESQPRVLPVCPPDVPRWVEILRDAPEQGAVIDFLGDDQSIGLYYQTIYHRPVAMGDVFRISVDTFARTTALLESVNRANFEPLGRMGFAYMVMNPSDPLLSLPVFYSDQAARIYRLSRG